VTATTGGAGNIPVSIAEDVTATALSILAILVPILLGCLLVLLTSLIIWGIWRRENSRRMAQLRS
jgi:sensor domain CHASE-containing protein